MAQMIILRGLPGCGKSTVARALKVPAVVCSADDFFMVGGEYHFDPSKIADAHAASQDKCHAALVKGQSVIIDNTCTCRWEMEPYLQMAREHGVEVNVVDLFDGECSDEQLHERNTHGVPLQAIQAMRERYEHNWQTGNPLPPWER